MKKSILLTSAMVMACSFANAQSVSNMQKMQMSKIDMSKNLRVFSATATADMKQVNGPKRSTLNGVKYLRPEGSYWMGMDDEGRSYKPSVLVTTPLTELCFKNVSTVSGTKWYIKTQNGYADASEYADADNNLLSSYPSSYEGAFYYPPMLATPDQKTTFTLGEWNEDGGFVTAYQSGNLCAMDCSAGGYGFNQPGYGFDENFLCGTGEWGLKKGYINTGLLNMYPAPMSPLYIEDTHTMVISSTNSPLPAGKTLTLTFYGLKGEGEETNIDASNVLGTMTATSEDVTVIQNGTSEYTSTGQLYYCMLKFASKGTDILGNPTSEPIVINEPYGIVMTGLEQEGVKFGLPCYEENTEDITYGEGQMSSIRTYFMLYNPTTEDQRTGSYQGSLSVAYNFTGVMDYVEPVADGYLTDGTELTDLNVLRVSADGATISNEGYAGFNGIKLNSAVAWYGEDGETEMYSCPMPEWITAYEVTAPTDENDTEMTMKFTCQPLPEGVAGRGAKLYIYGRGYTSATPIYVLQGNATKDDAVTGINGVETVKPASNGRMFNLAGQQVGKDFKGIVVKDGKKMIKK